MKKSMNLGKFCTCILVLLLVLLVWQPACKTEEPEVSQEVPITTSSDEALELFVEGRNFQEFGHLDKARERYDLAVEKDPNFALAWLYKSLTAAETDDHQDFIRKALELAPTTSEGEQKMLAAADAFFIENDRVKYNQLYQELAAMYPQDVRMQWYLGQTYFQVNKEDEAVAAWQNGLAIDPDFAPIHERLGYFYRGKEDYNKAEASFQEYLRLAPNEANAYDCLADLQRRMGKFEEALNNYKHAYEMDSSFQASAYKAATTQFFLGNFEEGRQGLKDLMELRKEPAFTVYDMQGIMRSYLFEGDFAKALEAQNKVIEMAEELGLPEEASWGLIYKGILHCEMKDYEAAFASIDKCEGFLEKADLVATYKTNQQAWATFWKAWVASENQDFENAKSLAQEFKVKLDAIGNPAWMDNYPWLMAFIALAEGDSAQALEFFDQTEMEWVFAVYYKGLAREKAGDMEGAKELYEKAANWNFDNQWTAIIRNKAAEKL